MCLCDLKGLTSPPKKMSVQAGAAADKNEEEGSNGKMGPTSEGFHNTNELGSVRHECELQGVMTS